MSDQPLTDDELKELEAIVGPVNLPMTYQQIRRLIAKVDNLQDQLIAALTTCCDLANKLIALHEALGRD